MKVQIVVLFLEDGKDVKVERENYHIVSAFYF